jgi:DNA-binding FadR family transcriptional regulator
MSVQAIRLTLRRGQLIVSERELSRLFGLPKTSLHGLIARLRDADMIDVARPSDQSRTECRPSADLRWTVITVKNYQQFQANNPESTDGADQSRTRYRPGSDQETQKY